MCIFTDRWKFYQDIRVDPKVSIESINTEYICELGLRLGYHYPNLNPTTIRDFYILNDFNYLNSKSKYNINLNLMVSLTETKFGLTELIEILSREKGLFNNNQDFSVFYSEYIKFKQNYNALFIRFDNHTLDVFNTRINNNDKFILPSEIKKSR